MNRWMTGGILFLSVYLIFFAGCHRPQKDRVFIKGRVEGMKDLIYLRQQTTVELLVIDSIPAETAGEFTFSPKATETSLFSVRLSPEEQVAFIASPGDSIRITGNLNVYPALLHVSGNKESELLQSFYSHAAGNLRKVDSLQMIVDMHQGDPDFFELTIRIDSMFNQIWEEQRKYEKDFIRSHAGNFSTLLVVNYHFGVRPVLSPKTDPEDYMRVDSGLMANYPDNSHTLFFHQWIKEVK